MACDNFFLIYDETFPISSSAVISILLKANHFFVSFCFFKSNYRVFLGS